MSYLDGRHGKQAFAQQVDKFRPQLEAYEALCRYISLHPAQVALAWILQAPGVTAAITGPRIPEQLRDNLATLDLALDNNILEKLDTIWSRPGGAAPMAYAW